MLPSSISAKRAFPHSKTGADQHQPTIISIIKPKYSQLDSHADIRGVYVVPHYSGLSTGVLNENEISTAGFFTKERAGRLNLTWNQVGLLIYDICMNVFYEIRLPYR